MEDAVYFTNILRGRECIVCGADRKAASTLAVTTCAVCHTSLDSDRSVLAIARGAAKATCSSECAEVALQEGLTGGEAGPACDSLWSAAHPPSRTCRVCTKDLSLDAGYIGLWESGRMQTFCGPGCLEMYRTRGNPFCG